MPCGAAGKHLLLLLCMGTCVWHGWEGELASHAFVCIPHEAKPVGFGWQAGTFNYAMGVCRQALVFLCATWCSACGVEKERSCVQ